MHFSAAVLMDVSQHMHVSWALFRLQSTLTQCLWCPFDCLLRSYHANCLYQVALLEALPNGPALDWPWVSRGKPEAGLDKVQAWDIAVPSSDAAAANSNMARVMASLNYGYSGVASNAFGTSGGCAGIKAVQGGGLCQQRVLLTTGYALLPGVGRPAPANCSMLVLQSGWSGIFLLSTLTLELLGPVQPAGTANL